jgi:hypothetical protein
VNYSPLLTLALVAGLTAPAEGHCFRIWKFPRPQVGCEVHRVVASKPAPRDWTVEIVKLPPLPPLTDDEARALAVDKLRDQLSGGAR